VLEEALSNYEGTLFVISHDRYFLNTVVDKIILLGPDGIKEYLGNYDYYIEKKKQLNDITTETVEEKTKTQIKEEKRKEREKKQSEKKLRVQRQNIEKEIMEVESEIENLNELMCQEDVYSNPEKSKEVTSKKSELETELENLYESWEGLI
jgi:ATP-binding cassette subfamily F protein 3